MSTKKETQKSINKKSKGFSAEEKAAIEGSRPGTEGRSACE